ncbi:MAG TPA: hypothetical protein PKA61_05045 [Nitrospira sp.]|nr:hypothetical protein [Nitrospira sp.]
MNEHSWVHASGQSLSGLSHSDEVRVMYSGVDHGTLVMGDARLTGVGSQRLDLTGTQPVRVGMSLTLLVFLSQAEEPVGIAEARVSEVSDESFGVDLLSTVKVSMSELEQHARQAIDRQHGA